MPFRLHYELSGSGWAQVHVESDSGQVSFLASYLSDCLRDLARVTIDIVSGAAFGAVDFMDEPGEHQLKLQRTEEGRIEFEVLEYHHWVSMHPSAKPVACKLKGTTTVAHLRGQVYSAMKLLLDTHGAKGYRDSWVNAPFPEVEYEKLRRLVA